MAYWDCGPSRLAKMRATLDCSAAFPSLRIKPWRSWNKSACAVTSFASLSLLTRPRIDQLQSWRPLQSCYVFIWKAPAAPLHRGKQLRNRTLQLSNSWAENPTPPKSGSGSPSALARKFDPPKSGARSPAAIQLPPPSGVTAAIAERSRPLQRGEDVK